MVGKHHRHLGRPHLGGVDATGHGDDHFTRPDQLVCLLVAIQLSGIREHFLNSSIFVSPLQVVRGRHHNEQELVTLGGLTYLACLDAIRKVTKHPKVLRNLRPIGQLAVRSDLEPKVVPRGRYI